MPNNDIILINVSKASYAEQICAAALQGLLNRGEACLFLDYGVYDDPQARRTNEVFLDDELWYGKYRQVLGNQDQNNRDYYRTQHNFTFSPIPLQEAVQRNLSVLRGCVIWDANQPDTVNIALMLAAQDNLLVLEASLQSWAGTFNLPILHDLRGRWQNRLEIYEWAFEHLLPDCKAGHIACIEPAWQRPEFVDYIVQNKIFVYNLSSQQKGLAQTILFLLAFGPTWLRELIFTLRLNQPLARLAIGWMAAKSAEVKLNLHIQKSVQSTSYPTIFGWHTVRDDELSFMLFLSANGLRLVPSHLASNFSFHACVKPQQMSLIPDEPALPPLDVEGVYLTFTLSDGDQLMMMSTAQMGSWNSTLRGQVPFNWEIQPLLLEIAPALLQKYQSQASANDCLIAGPSGAGYVIPPLVSNLTDYMRETSRICRQVGIRVVTSYSADPTRTILKTICQNSQGLTGFLAGYATLHAAPQLLCAESIFIANQIPNLQQLSMSAEDLLAEIQKKIQNLPARRPAFVAVHLFAYRTIYADIVEFAQQQVDPHLHIVRADTFLQLAKQYLSKK